MCLQTQGERTWKGKPQGDILFVFVVLSFLHFFGGGGKGGGGGEGCLLLCVAKYQQNVPHFNMTLLGDQLRQIAC